MFYLFFGWVHHKVYYLSFLSSKVLLHNNSNIIIWLNCHTVFLLPIPGPAPSHAEIYKCAMWNGQVTPSCMHMLPDHDVLRHETWPEWGNCVSSDFKLAREMAEILCGCLLQKGLEVYRGGVIFETRLRERWGGGDAVLLQYYICSVKMKASKVPV